MVEANLIEVVIGMVQMCTKKGGHPCDFRRLLALCVQACLDTLPWKPKCIMQHTAIVRDSVHQIWPATVFVKFGQVLSETNKSLR